MSAVVVRENLDVRGFVSSKGTELPSGGVRSVEPSPQSAAGTYILDQFEITKFRAVDYLIYVSQPEVPQYSVRRMLVLHDGITGYFNEFGTIETGSSDVSFSVTITDGVLVLSYTQDTDTPTAVTAMVISILS